MVTNEEAIQNIAANVSALLVDNGWSQGELCRRTKESRMTISSLVNGKHMPGAALLARIAEAFDVSMESLLAAPRKKSRRSA